ncbi:MAG: putative toxin-antitoxin system toxin component, PIN family [Ignavibacteriae bacterium]|nr:putative toxin-antitoxin system toxin component, PIN family [Ignavibacteriota bacterium]
MQNIVLDTNVFVSSLIQRGYSYRIVNELFIEGAVELCISEEVMQEYYEVLTRKKFSKYPEFIIKAETLLADIDAKARKFSPKTKVTIIGDVDDNKFLELAEESKSHFLITGNTNDFTMQVYKRTKIVTPKEYWEQYRP